MSITLDFDNDTMSITEEGHTSTLHISLKDKKTDIYKAIGLQELPMDELRQDINGLFRELGLENVKCTE